MTSHTFGGRWTADKLDALRRYLGFFTQALKGQRYELVYIDAFAGTGRCKVRARSDHAEIDGSALIALDCSPPFSRYRFIEGKPKHAAALQALIDAHPNGKRAHIDKDLAQDALPRALAAFDWQHSRGVMFLDPYGLQCTWAMLEQIRRTEALDVFFLVSLSGLYRQAAVNEAGIDEAKAARLTAFLGTEEWRDHLYTQQQGALFDAPTVTRSPGWTDILSFTTARLRTLFPYVADPAVLGQANGAPLFALYFAVANPSRAAIGLASRVGNDIFSRLR